jgi:hypothetical protein
LFWLLKVPAWNFSFWLKYHWNFLSLASNLREKKRAQHGEGEVERGQQDLEMPSQKEWWIRKGAQRNVTKTKQRRNKIKRIGLKNSGSAKSK